MPKLPKLGNLCELIDDGLRRIPQPDKCVFCINVKWGSILFVLMELIVSGLLLYVTGINTYRAGSSFIQLRIENGLGLILASITFTTAFLYLVGAISKAPSLLLAHILWLWVLLFILLNATLVAVFLGPTEIDLDDIMYVIFVVLGFFGWTYMQTVLFTHRERVRQSGIRA